VDRVGELLVTIANQPSLGVLILILAIIVDMLFGLGDRAIRRRWGLTGTV
jgi:hypothetical protein